MHHDFQDLVRSNIYKFDLNLVQLLTVRSNQAAISLNSDSRFG